MKYILNFITAIFSILSGILAFGGVSLIGLLIYGVMQNQAGQFIFIGMVCIALLVGLDVIKESYRNGTIGFITKLHGTPEMDRRE